MGLWGAMPVHVGLLLFGWVLSRWSIVMFVALVRLLRTERHQPTTSNNASHPVVEAFGLGNPK